MKTDAQPSAGAEKEALQWAIGEFQRNKALLKFGGTAEERAAWIVKVLLYAGTASDGEIFLAGSEFDRAADYVEAAQHGDKLGTKVSLALGAALIERGEVLREPLRELIVEFLRNPKPPKRGAGRKASDLVERNSTISYVIGIVAIRWKFSATRNEATQNPSAVSIVQAALEKVGINLTEAAVTRIWNRSGISGVPARLSRRSHGRKETKTIKQYDKHLQALYFISMGAHAPVWR